MWSTNPISARGPGHSGRPFFEREFPAGVDVYYAGKAFLCTAVARWIAAEGLSLDVCTGGELAVALAAGTAADRIAMHGNNKSTADGVRSRWGSGVSSSIRSTRSTGSRS